MSKLIHLEGMEDLSTITNNRLSLKIITIQWMSISNIFKRMRIKKKHKRVIMGMRSRSRWISTSKRMKKTSLPTIKISNTSSIRVTSSSRIREVSKI